MTAALSPRPLVFLSSMRNPGRNRATNFQESGELAARDLLVQPGRLFVFADQAQELAGGVRVAAGNGVQDLGDLAHGG